MGFGNTVLALSVLVGVSGSANDAPTVGNPEFRLRLLEMAEADQAARVSARRAPAETHAGLDSLDARHEFQLNWLVGIHGWPSRDTVGADGMWAAFLIIQHSSREFRKAMFPFVQSSAEAGDLEAWCPAMLEDRIRVSEGRPQRYGTQLRVEGGRYTPLPIEDEAGVDERRRAVGLAPMKEYLERAGEALRSGEEGD